MTVNVGRTRRLQVDPQCCRLSAASGFLLARFNENIDDGLWPAYQLAVQPVEALTGVPLYGLRCCVFFLPLPGYSRKPLDEAPGTLGSAQFLACSSNSGTLPPPGMLIAARTAGTAAALDGATTQIGSPVLIAAASRDSPSRGPIASIDQHDRRRPTAQRIPQPIPHSLRPLSRGFNTQPNRWSATRPIDNYGWILPPLIIRTFRGTQDIKGVNCRRRRSSYLQPPPPFT